MLNTDSELIQIYKNDGFPTSDQVSPKDIELSFPDLDLTIGSDQIAEDKGEFELSESICLDDQLKIGKCNTSLIKITLADVSDRIKGQEFNITQKVYSGDKSYDMPLGYFTVDSAEKQEDLRFKDVIAFDRMKRTNTDVTDWYNGLTFPMTLAAFRASFLTYIGIEEDLSRLPLPNDSMTVTRTIEPTKLSGITVIEACEEINGCFGHINRYGKFTHIFLKKDFGLYPSETLYPADDLYPEYGTEIFGNAAYQTVRFEEYTVKEIDKLQIRQEEGDVGAIAGTGTNSYVIEGNFLVYGKSADELQALANNIFNVIEGIPYRPYRSTNKGLPYLEVGDAIAFETANDYIISYIFNRTLKGTQVLVDEFEATGAEEVKQDFSTNNQIIQLQGKMAVIKKSVESVSATVSDLDEQLTSEINVLAGQIELKVDAAGVIAAINLSPGSVQISADKINLTGYTKFTDLATAGETIINGSNIKTGTIDAGLVNVVNLNAENITAGTFSGDRINGGSIYGITINGSMINGSTFNRTVNGSVWTAIDDAGFFQNVTGGLSFQVGYYSQTGYIYVDGTSIQMGPSGYALAINDGGVFINGSKPITEGNIATYAAPQGHTHTTLWNGSYLAYLSSSGNFASGNGGNLGAPSARWGMVYLSSSPDVSSDRNAKHDITDLDAVYKRLILQSKPVKYKYNDGTSDRWHTGFISQDYEELLKELGLTTKDFAAFVKSPIYAKHLVNDDGHELPDYDTSSEIIGYAHGLRYEELIAPAVSVMQEQQVLIEELFTRVKLLEGRY